MPRISDKQENIIDILALPLQEISARAARGELSAKQIAQACVDAVQAREAQARAWQHFDANQLLEQAARLDARVAQGGARGALFGIPVGVKDLLDTVDMPTTYGSPIYAGYRPVADAACVSACREEGALIAGKTVSTEFAYFQPGPTRNPRATADHTPGGSSSGSAAAVAAGMVPIAFGTQTAGSIIRPAAYCGVVGYKPTHGTLPLAGVKSLAPSLDTIGVLAQRVDDAAFLVGALARLRLHREASPASLRVGLCQTPYWERASSGARAALEKAGQLMSRAGAQVREIVLANIFADMVQAQITIMSYEMAAAFTPESSTHGAQMSEAISTLLASGRTVTGEEFQRAQASVARARLALAEVFAEVDVLLVPSAEGEAPAGLSATGDPVFNRMWTALGNPCVQVPVMQGALGLPLGVTVVGARWNDATALAAARVLEAEVQA